MSRCTRDAYEEGRCAANDSRRFSVMGLVYQMVASTQSILAWIQEGP